MHESSGITSESINEFPGLKSYGTVKSEAELKSNIRKISIHEGSLEGVYVFLSPKILGSHPDQV
jgi:hypothetical protein